MEERSVSDPGVVPSSAGAHKVMKMWRCYSCSKKFSGERIRQGPRCPYCGGRILLKCRPEIVRKVKDVKINAGKMPF